jgi:hypothetical protein
MPDYSKAVKSKGGLYAEQNRQKDTHPHYRGFVNVSREQAKIIAQAFKSDNTLDEMNVRIAGWKNSNDRGTYLSLNVEVMPPEEKQAPMQAQAQPVPPQEDFDDDIPF